MFHCADACRVRKWETRMLSWAQEMGCGRWAHSAAARFWLQRHRRGEGVEFTVAECHLQGVYELADGLQMQQIGDVQVAPRRHPRFEGIGQRARCSEDAQPLEQGVLRQRHHIALIKRSVRRLWSWSRS